MTLDDKTFYFTIDAVTRQLLEANGLGERNTEGDRGLLFFI